MDVKALRQFIANKSPKHLTEASAASVKALEHVRKSHQAISVTDLGTAQGEQALEHLEDALAALKGDPILNAKDKRYNRPLSWHIQNTTKEFDDALALKNSKDIKRSLSDLRYELEDIIDLLKNG